MAITVRIPTPLRRYTGGQRQVALEADTVSGVLDGLVALFPDIRGGLYRPDGALRSDMRVFVGSDDVRARDGLDTPVASGATVSIIPPVAGA
jgi:molybdopterin synthase sulfur carrier subunit